MSNRCQNSCAGWDNMINFVYKVPYYMVADKCIECDIWFPKHTLIRCPCCNTLLRRKRQRYQKGQTKARDLKAEEVRARIQKAMDDGWVLLNEDIWKTVLEYRMAHNIPLKVTQTNP